MGNLDFRIDEDGTIIRGNEPNKPENQRNKGIGWLWFLVIAAIAGIGIYAYIESRILCITLSVVFWAILPVLAITGAYISLIELVATPEGRRKSRER